MRVLFISNELENKSGGGMVMRSYLKLFQNIVGRENVVIFSVVKSEQSKGDIKKYKKIYSPNPIIKIKNCIFHWNSKINLSIEGFLNEIIENEQIDVVFLGRSTDGRFVKTIKENKDIPIISFFHDIFPMVISGRIQNDKIRAIIHMPSLIAMCYSEKYCAEKSNACLVLNQRDYEAFRHYYGKFPTMIAPIICDDKCKNLEAEMVKKLRIGNEDTLILCFVGAYFTPNIHGLEWFCNKVLPNLSQNIELWIVGNNMELMADRSCVKDRRIKIIGTVDSLNSYYISCDIVIAPIFEGTGMKTKTAEALMYGKTIIGTPESFCGYDLYGFEKDICSDEKEFIERIEYYEKNRPDRFLEEKRRIYLDKHSVIQMESKVKHLIESIVKMG